MIEIRSISKRYDDKQVLENFSLTLPNGITCLMGVSGAGKTTLLRLLTGLETPDSGSIQNLPGRIAMVFQEDRLTDSMTVRGNLKLSLGKRYDAAKAQQLLDRLLLPNVLGQTVANLSGGMKRRIALCRALLFDAPLLVLDEPFKGLDEVAKQAAMDAVKQHAAGRQVLLVTHDEDEGVYLGAEIVRI